jgi:hypothetical protein
MIRAAAWTVLLFALFPAGGLEWIAWRLLRWLFAEADFGG